MKWVVALATLTCVLVVQPAAVHGQKRITIGLYAPTAPFIGPSQRLEYVTRLAAHLAKVAPNKRVVGRVFASSSAFVAAVKRGDVQFAVVDAPYAAARGVPYKVLASVSRGGSSSGAWMLVAKPTIASLAALRGKTLAMPRVGARQRAFVANVLFEGEIDTKFFGKLTRAPDAHSAVTLVGLGRAHAAVVPQGIALSRGVRSLVALRRVGWPMFVAMRGVNTQLVSRFKRQVLGFSGGRVFPRFTAATAADYQGLRRSFGGRNRRGPMATAKPSRLAVTNLMRGRAFRIQVIDITSLVTAK